MGEAIAAWIWAQAFVPSIPSALATLVKLAGGDPVPSQLGHAIVLQPPLLESQMPV